MLRNASCDENYKMWFTHKEQRTHKKPEHHLKWDSKELQQATDVCTGLPGGVSCRRAALLPCASRAELGSRSEPTPGKRDSWQLFSPLCAEPAHPHWVRQQYCRLERKQGVSRQMGFKWKELTLQSPL